MSDSSAQQIQKLQARIAELEAALAQQTKSIEPQRPFLAPFKPKNLIESIIDTLTTEICVIDSTGIILYVNRAWCHFYQASGIKTPESGVRPFVGCNYLQFYDAIASIDTPSSRQICDIYCGIMAVMDGTLPHFKSEYRCESPTEQRWFFLVIMPFNDGSGRIMVNHENITELKQAELCAKQYEAIVNYSEDAIIAMDRQSQITHWNHAAEQIFGYTQAEIIGKPVDDLYPKPLPNETAAIQQVQEGISVDHFESIRRSKNGITFPVSVTLSPIKNSAGDCVGISEIIRNISHLKQQQLSLQKTEKDLLKTRRLLRSLIDAVPTGLAHWNKQHRCIVANQAYACYMGKTSPQQLIGRAYLEVVDSNAFMNDLPLIQRALAGEIVTTERLIKNPETHEPQSIMMRFFPLFEDEEIDGFYVQIEDVTSIANAREAAMAANLAKSSFLATISHEIRTPLNAIIGMTYLLQSTSLSTGQLSDIKTIEISSKNLLSLINDVLDISKIEAGELEMDFHHFSIREMLDDLHTLFAAMARDKLLDFYIDLPDENIPDVLQSDSHRVKQILINLLNNAIKFTLKGFIRLSVSVLESNAPNQICLRFSVEDSGIGIKPQVQKELFQPFTQADTSTTRRFGGTGLGLSIIKQLALMLKGEVGFKSKLDQGSTFWVDLPFLIADPQSSCNLVSSKTEPLQIVLWMTDEAEQTQIANLCRDLNWTVHIVDHSETSLDSIVQPLKQNNRLFCVILDDQQAMAESLKSQLIEQKTAFITLSETGDLSTEVIFNKVTQPLIQQGHDVEDVFNAAIIDFKHHQWLSGIHILVVDDSVINLDVIQRILVHEGAAVSICESGQRAVEILKTVPENSFDGILMDLQMPGMDGYDTTLYIRNTLGLIDVPIIALTGGATTTEQQKALAAGMDEFLAKPVEPSRLIQFLKKYIEFYRQTSLPLVQRSLPDSEKKQPDWPEIAEIDRDDVYARLGGDMDLFKKSLRQFIQEFANISLQEAEQNNTEQGLTLAKRFHKLAGNSGLLGARSIQQISQRIEHQLKNGTDPTIDFRQLTERLERLVESGQDFIESSSPEPASSQVTLTQARLEQLRKQLRANKISSLKIYQDISAGLRQHLSEDDYHQLNEAINRLDFRSALAWLDHLDLAEH